VQVTILAGLCCTSSPKGIVRFWLRWKAPPYGTLHWPPPCCTTRLGNTVWTYSTLGLSYSLLTFNFDSLPHTGPSSYRYVGTSACVIISYSKACSPAGTHTLCQEGVWSWDSIHSWTYDRGLRLSTAVIANHVRNECKRVTHKSEYEARASGMVGQSFEPRWKAMPYKGALWLICLVGLPRLSSTWLSRRLRICLDSEWAAAVLRPESLEDLEALPASRNAPGSLSILSLVMSSRRFHFTRGSTFKCYHCRRTGGMGRDQFHTATELHHRCVPDRKA